MPPAHPVSSGEPRRSDTQEPSFGRPASSSSDDRHQPPVVTPDVSCRLLLPGGTVEDAVNTAGSRTTKRPKKRVLWCRRCDWPFQYDRQRLSTDELQLLFYAEVASCHPAQRSVIYVSSELPAHRLVSVDYALRC